ncbi:uncharacterized protein L203_103493 [Cryptococcus depauperatus CBS 7841]|uniref:Uncharacterized protein n=1 Tax=Cryptococcus depauperatus CBS 7841 TaxID=1295531 RepID=A0A1E3II81_9TREE|nr:hypothetical protein L203_02911 [Cryptococcus depauperatus CBS 7841]
MKAHISRWPARSAAISQKRFAYTLPTNLPPIRQRLRPYVPFFIYWTVITSLIVHVMRARQDTQASLARQDAKISVLTDLIARLQRGDRVPEDDMRRELEMVGLRERTVLTDDLNRELKVSGYIGWKEMLLGKKKPVDDAKDEQILQEWAQTFFEPTESPAPDPSTIPFPPAPEQKVARRASGSNVYL